MDSVKRYEAALAYAEKMHSGQFRMGGKPYISHPIAVAEIVKEWGYDIDYQITALFHDLIEDTEAKDEDILALGGSDVLEAVHLLTKKDGYKMDVYIAGIKNNPIAFCVKAADRFHNLRSALVTNEEFKRKYVLETINWYLDFCPEIEDALRALVHSMDSPITSFY